MDCSPPEYYTQWLASLIKPDYKNLNTEEKSATKKKKKKKFLMYLQTSLNQKAKETSAITLNLLAAIYHYYS